MAKGKGKWVLPVLIRGDSTVYGILSNAGVLVATKMPRDKGRHNAVREDGSNSGVSNLSSSSSSGLNGSKSTQGQ